MRTRSSGRVLKKVFKKENEGGQLVARRTKGELLSGLEITRGGYIHSTLIIYFSRARACMCVFKVIETRFINSFVSFSRETINWNNDSVEKLTNLSRNCRNIQQFSLQNYNTLWKTCRNFNSQETMIWKNDSVEKSINLILNVEQFSLQNTLWKTCHRCIENLESFGTTIQ